MRTFVFPLLILVVGGVLWWAFRPEEEPDLVLYCGVDQDQSRLVVTLFQKETGLTVRFEGENEAFRSIGLPRKLKEEQGDPRADVFWANEIMNMDDLGRRGLLAPLPEGVAEKFPPAWRDPAGHYAAFGARGRILLVNTELLPDPEDYPRSIEDLLDERYAEMGLKTCMARPLTGTTYTHAVALLTRDEDDAKAFLEACAKAGEEGRMKITPSNGSAMRETRDPKNRIAFCLTDTDDAWKAIRDGYPVAVVYPDQGEEEMGTVLIPNTVALVKGGPHPKNGVRFLEWLIRPETEALLARGPSAQIPLRPELERAQLPAHVKRPGVEFRAAQIDWAQVGENRDRWRDWLTTTFRPAP
ncbi:MAG: extracellular solute-binding protein [Planctomycetota bacterium]